MRKLLSITLLLAACSGGGDGAPRTPPPAFAGTWSGIYVDHRNGMMQSPCVMEVSAASIERVVATLTVDGIPDPIEMVGQGQEHAGGVVSMLLVGDIVFEPVEFDCLFQPDIPGLQFIAYPAGQRGAGASIANAIMSR